MCNVFSSDPFAAHHEYMRQMMRSFSDPFGRDPFFSITDGEERTVDRRVRPDSQVALRGNRRVSLFLISKDCYTEFTFTGNRAGFTFPYLLNLAQWKRSLNCYTLGQIVLSLRKMGIYC